MIHLSSSLERKVRAVGLEHAIVSKLLFSFSLVLSNIDKEILANELLFYYCYYLYSVDCNTDIEREENDRDSRRNIFNCRHVSLDFQRCIFLNLIRRM